MSTYHQVYDISTGLIHAMYSAEQRAISVARDMNAHYHAPKYTVAAVHANVQHKTEVRNSRGEMVRSL